MNSSTTRSILLSKIIRTFVITITSILLFFFAFLSTLIAPLFITDSETRGRIKESRVIQQIYSDNDVTFIVFYEDSHMSFGSGNKVLAAFDKNHGPLGEIYYNDIPLIIRSASNSTIRLLVNMNDPYAGSWTRKYFNRQILYEQIGTVKYSQKHIDTNVWTDRKRMLGNRYISDENIARNRKPRRTEYVTKLR